MLHGLSVARNSADDYCFASAINHMGLINSVRYLMSTTAPNYTAYFVQLGVIHFGISMGLYENLLYVSIVILGGLNFYLRFEKYSDNRLRFILFNIATSQIMIISLLLLPSAKPGAHFLTTLGWNAGSSRVLALVCVLLLVLYIQLRSRSWIILSILIVLLGGCDLLVSAGINFYLLTFVSLLIIFKKRRLSEFRKFIILPMCGLIGDLLLSQTQGSKERIKALNLGMRNGESVHFNSKMFQVAKYNLYRITTESNSTKFILYLTILGFVYAIYLKNANSKNQIIDRQLLSDLGKVLPITLIVAMGTWIGSIEAYLQSWHFILIDYFLSLALLCAIIWAFTHLVKSMVNWNTFITVTAALMGLYLSWASLQLAGSFEKTRISREVAYDFRSINHLQTNIPILSMNKIPLTEDIDSKWVNGCYRSIS